MVLDLEYNYQLGQSGGYFFLGNRLDVPFSHLLRFIYGLITVSSDILNPHLA